MCSYAVTMEGISWIDPHHISLLLAVYSPTFPSSCNNSGHAMFVMIISLATRALDWPTLSILSWKGTEEQVDSGTSFCGFSIRSRRVLRMAVSSKVATVYKHHTMKVWKACESKALHILSISWRSVVGFTLWLLCDPEKGLLGLTGNKIMWVPEQI